MNTPNKLTVARMILVPVSYTHLYLTAPVLGIMHLLAGAVLVDYYKS